MPRPDARILLGLLSLSLLAAAPPTAPPSRPDSAAFGERIDVRAVDVEVVVTDAKGERVKGLTAADFILKVDGREERIDSFAEVAEGETAPPPAPAAVAADSAPPQRPAPPNRASGGRVATSYLVFIDDVFATSSQRNAALFSLQRDISLLRPNDRMAVVAFGAKGLTVLAGWTADAARLRQAIAEANRREALGNRIVADRRGDDRATATAAQDLYADADLLAVAPGGLPWQIGKNAGALGEVATAAADALRGLPLPAGRRVMLALAGSWPWDGDPRVLQPLTTTANLLGYTIYPVHAGGADPLDEAANSEIATTKSEVEASHVVFQRPNSTWERLAENALRSVARATGGVAALDRDHSLRQAVADTRSYYWLGFSPIWHADNKPHAIAVEVRRSGLTARARGRFFDLSRETMAAMTAEGVLAVGGDPAQKRLEVTLGTPKPIDAKTVEVPLTLAIPGDALAHLAKAANGFPVEGQLAIAGVDEKGGRAVLPGRTLRALLPEERPGVFVRTKTTLRLSRLPQRLIFTVTGADDGTMVWTEAAFQP